MKWPTGLLLVMFGSFALVGCPEPDPPPTPPAPPDRVPADPVPEVPATPPGAEEPPPPPPDPLPPPDTLPGDGAVPDWRDPAMGFGDPALARTGPAPYRGGFAVRVTEFRIPFWQMMNTRPSAAVRAAAAPPAG